MVEKSLLKRTPKIVETLDATLREGVQARGVNFTLQSRARIALELDELGVQVIEAGWPAANPKDQELFRTLKDYSFSRSKIAAFTSTRRKNTSPDKDVNLEAVIKCDVDVAVVVGKTWDLHVREVLKATLDENLNMISDSIEYLRSHGIRVIFDAEHFFDGYKDNPLYALEALRAAQSAGANVLVLADTNGGCLPHEVETIVHEVANSVKGKIGLHMHNDSGNAVANTLIGVVHGAEHVQVTINGIGERTGNADLCQVLPNLEIKMGIRALDSEKPAYERLKALTRLSRLVYDLSGVPKNPYQPYVGEYAFAHKAGMHVDAVLKLSRAYEHVNPELVGNKRLLTVSDLTGRAGIVAKIAEELGIEISKSRVEIERLLNDIKQLGLREVDLDNATATVSLLILKHLGMYEEHFKILEWKSLSEGMGDSSKAFGLVKLKVGDKEFVEGSEGVGPVHAIDVAVRKVLEKRYPKLKEVKLIDYRVLLPEAARDTSSIVRVYISFSDGKRIWSTTATSTNIVEASLKALIEGFDYYLQTRSLKRTV